MPTGAKVKIVQPPHWDAKKYGNPEYGGQMSTTASFAVRGYFKPMRVAGAQARRVLIDAAASEVGRAGERADDRAERGRAQGLEPAHELRRDRRLCDDAGGAAQDRGQGSQANVAASA